MTVTVFIIASGTPSANGASDRAVEETHRHLRVTTGFAPAVSETPTATPTATRTPTATSTPTETPTETSPSAITFSPPALSFDAGSFGTIEVMVNDPDAAVVTSLTVESVEGLTVTKSWALSITNDFIQAYTFTSSAPGPYTLTFTATFDTPAKTATADLVVAVNAVVAGDIVKPTAYVLAATKHGAPSPGFTIVAPDGTNQRAFLPVTSSTAEVFVIPGDFDGDGIDSVLIGYGRRDLGRVHGPGSAVSVDPLNRGADVPPMVPFPFEHPASFDNNPTGEVRVAAGNLMGDAADELIVIQGANAQSRLRICGVRPGGTFANIDANSFRPSQLGNPEQGIEAITADLDGDGFDEIITVHASKVDFGTGLTGNYMQAMNIANPGTQSMTNPIPASDIVWAEKQKIFSDTSNPSGGLNMAAGDLNGDGEVEVVVVTAAPNPSDPTNRGNSKLTVLVPNFTDGNLANGSFSVMKDGGGTGGNICVRLFSETTNPSGDVSVSVADLNGDDKDEIVVSRGVSIGETVAKSDVTVFYFDESGVGAGVLNRFPKVELPQVYSTEENPGGGANVAASIRLPLLDETSTAHVSTIPLPDLPSGATPLEMVLIPSGTFMMGPDTDNRGRSLRGAPQHAVTLTKSFYLGKCEVTQAQWEAVMGGNPSTFGGKPNHPVESVSWGDCQAFIRQLNGLNLGTFRLPTEAEWEYACRAGTNTIFSFGDALECSNYHSYCALMDKYMWWGGNRTHSGNVSNTREVGLKLPNPWGLHDMHGNVYEWCSDWFGSTYYSSSPQVDPRGPSSGSLRAGRGGDYYFSAWECRSRNRGRITPDDRYGTIGFRLVREYP